MRQSVAEGNRAQVIAAASACAPYIHPRLTSAEVKVDDARAREWARMEAMTDEEMANEIAEIEQRMKECDESDAFLRKLREARETRVLDADKPIN